MNDRILKAEEIEVIRDMLYDRAKRSHAFHRTGENFSEPLLKDWIQLANLFRDADRIVVSVRADSVSERGYED